MDLVRAIIAAGFLLAPALPTPTLAVIYIYTLVVGLQIFTSLFNPARSAVVPALVPTPHLGAANAMIGIVAQAAMLIGPAIGGLLLQTSPDAIWWGGAVVALLAGAVLLQLGDRIPDPLRQAQAPAALAAAPEAA